MYLDINVLIRARAKTLTQTLVLENANKFKLLFLDIGLLQCALGIDPEVFMTTPLTNEGVLAEQFVGQELLASFPFYKEAKLYYWSREAKSSNAEVDYLFQKENEI